MMSCAPLGIGDALWFFFDTFNDADQLDVNQQFTGGAGMMGMGMMGGLWI